jgi:hypothetical protein
MANYVCASIGSEKNEERGLDYTMLTNRFCYQSCLRVQLLLSTNSHGRMFEASKNFALTRREMSTSGFESRGLCNLGVKQSTICMKRRSNHCFY